MRTAEITAAALAADMPADVAAAAASNGGLPPPPVCHVCLGRVRPVSELERLSRRREPNVPVFIATPGESEKHPLGVVRHSYCAPGTARWARHSDRSDPRVREVLVWFGYDPDGDPDGVTEEDEAMASKKAKSKRAPKEKVAKDRDKRIPAPGSVIRKEYDGKTHEVRVTSTGFTYNGDVYPSLSAVAHVITKKRYTNGISGFVFFKKQLEEKTGAAA